MENAPEAINVPMRINTLQRNVEIRKENVVNHLVAVASRIVAKAMIVAVHPEENHQVILVNQKTCITPLRLVPHQMELKTHHLA